MKKKCILFLGIICIISSFNVPTAESFRFGFGKRRSAAAGGGSGGGGSSSKGSSASSVGGYMQLVSHDISKEDKKSESMYLKRLRPHVTGKAHSGWYYMAEWEMGKETASGKHELKIKDAYLKYTGFKGYNLFIGNDVFPFSREKLVAGNERLLIERTFTGDRNYGVPGRQLGVHAKGHSDDWKLLWRASAVKTSFSGNSNSGNSKTYQLIADNPVGNKEITNPSLMYGGRIDYYPKGRIKMTQGTFKKSSSSKYGFGIGYYTWDKEENDKRGLNSVTGTELSAVYRGNGLSVDAQYNTIEAPGSGLFNKEDKLTVTSIEGGYILKPWRTEAVYGYEIMETEGKRPKEWTRTTIGINYYFKAHDIKFQANYRKSENENFDPKDKEKTDMILQLHCNF